MCGERERWYIQETDPIEKRAKEFSWITENKSPERHLLDTPVELLILLGAGGWIIPGNILPGIKQKQKPD